MALKLVRDMLGEPVGIVSEDGTAYSVEDVREMLRPAHPVRDGDLMVGWLHDAADEIEKAHRILDDFNVPRGLPGREPAECTIAARIALLNNESLNLDVDEARREGLCDICRREHSVWIAPSDIWNQVCRGGDRGNPDKWGFLCPTCFMREADKQRLAPTGWLVAPEPGGLVRYASWIKIVPGEGDA